MKNIFSPTRINYLYFGFLFVCIACLHMFHVLLIEVTSPWSQLAFLVDAALQSLLEVSFLLLLSIIVQPCFSRSVFYAYVALTFLLLIVHLVDFMLVRIMGFTFWYGMPIVLDESLKNFLEILKSSSVSLSVWALAAGIAISLPFIGVLFFFLCQKWEEKRELSISITKLTKVTCGIVALLGVWDLCTILPTSPVNYEKLCKTLPLKATVFASSTQKIALRSIMPFSKMESGVLGELPVVMTPAHKPDVFIFVIESLREDFITDAVAPCLSQFKKENVSFELALSAANATQLSWFSLFYSKFPFNWMQIGKEQRKTGSPALKMFKDMGYAIHVYTSARLGFYEMDEKLFGEKNALIDHFYFFGHGGEIPPSESDERSMDKLTE